MEEHENVRAEGCVECAVSIAQSPARAREIIAQ